MYGGHITDYWDRRCNTTYLDVLLQEQIFKGIMLAPGFRAPNSTKLNFAQLDAYILDKLPRDSPPMFRMHPNAEIGYLSTASTALFNTIMVLEKGGGGSGDGSNKGEGVMSRIETLLNKMPESFNEVEIRLRATTEIFDEQKENAPYVLVVLQEIRRMNRLTNYMTNTMTELVKGMNGELNMSQGMEELQEALTINQVPGRNIFHQTSWEAIAWPSKRPLDGWFSDTLSRIKQLQDWSKELKRPVSTWLPALFNPMAFLTALMQVTGRKNNLPLDNMTIETHITIYSDIPSIDGMDHPEDGDFCHGLFLEGARWGGYTMEGANEDEDNDDEIVDEDVYEVSGTKCGGHLLDSRLKELLPLLPIVYFKAVTVQEEWEACEVGYIRHTNDVYDCPVYSTTFRGPTYVVLATLKSVDPTWKWVLAGVAIIMQEDK
jgi:dynein heavy chain